MPGTSQPQLAPPGTVLVVGPPDRRQASLAAVEKLGLAAVEFDDPYAAMADLCRQPGRAAALLLSLHGLYREELQLIPAAKRAHPHAEVWLTDIDARPAALAEAMRLGADGLLGEDGLHRLGGGGAPAAEAVGGAGDAARDLVRAGHGTQAAAGDGAVTHDAPGGGVPLFAEAQRIGRVTHPGPDRAAAAPACDASATDRLPASARSMEDDEPYGSPSGEPILTADELRALLQDHPDPAPASRDDA